MKSLKTIKLSMNKLQIEVICNPHLTFETFEVHIVLQDSLFHNVIIYMPMEIFKFSKFSSPVPSMRLKSSSQPLNDNCP